MGIYVNTNVTALRGQNYLQNVNSSLNTTYQRLASGLRINSAKDDSAGLQIADRLTSQVNGLNQGNRNANDGIALAQTIEGGLDEISTMLQRMRTLAVQSANGTNTADDRTAIDNEAQQLALEITRIAEQTTFGGKTVLRGFKDNTSNNNSHIYGSSKTASGSGATHSLTPSKDGIITFQVGANSGDRIDLQVASFTFSDLAANAVRASHTSAVGFTGNGKIGLGTADLASASISSIDKMIQLVDSQRSSLGSIQNRLESAIKVQSNVSTNTADARSRIRDTDFAEESANLSQQSIIQQAATSMLMQANARPQLGLSLLG